MKTKSLQNVSKCFGSMRTPARVLWQCGNFDWAYGHTGHRHHTACHGGTLIFLVHKCSHYLSIKKQEIITLWFNTCTFKYCLGIANEH